jgi:hypothetical protein
MVTAAPIASALINKYGCRPVCNLGAIIAALAFIVGSFSQSLNFLMVTYGIIGGDNIIVTITIIIIIIIIVIYWNLTNLDLIYLVNIL